MSRSMPFGFLWQVIGPFRRRALLVLALVLLDTILASLGIGMILPVFQALLSPDFNNAFLARALPFLTKLGPSARIFWLATIMIAVFGLKACVGLASVITSRRFSENLSYHWMEHIGERYLYGPYGGIQAQKQGVLLNNWFNEPVAGARFFLAYINLISAIMLALALITLGLIVNWQATSVVILGGTVVSFLAGKRIFGTSARLGQLKLRLNQALGAAMNESLGNSRDIKLMGAERNILENLKKIARDRRSVFVKVAVYSELPRVLSEFFAVAALMTLVAGSITLLGLRPDQILPLFAFFFVAVYRLITAASQVVSGRMKTLNDLQSVRLVHELGSGTAATEDKISGLPIARLETDIRIEGVSFFYGKDAAALRGIDIIIPKGRTTYLVGGSGAGKSTLLDLLLRLRTPTDGRIVANGHDISQFNLPQWRRLFGYVSQDAALFHGSLSTNLKMAKPDATDKEVVAACQLAGADKFINDLPKGYETLVGDRGYSLSGGQRKRIAIGRALINQPDVLILDEATSSFEQSLERELIHELSLKLPGLTILQVTHRLQSAVDADFVVVLDQGRVAATGTWEGVRQEAEHLLTGTGLRETE